jgi:hypothetical protein
MLGRANMKDTMEKRGLLGKFKKPARDGKLA